MKLFTKKVEMTCSLVLDEKEIEMLAYLAGFGGTQIAEAICKGLTNKYKKEDWDTLWSQLRTELERTSNHYHDVRQVFNGYKRAVPMSNVIDKSVET